MLKLIGLSLILTASGAVGAGLAGTVRRQQAQTLALIDALLRIRHELLYRLTPLPEIFTVLSGSRNREIADFFSRACVHAVLSMQACTVGYACRKAFAQTRGLCLPSAAQDTLLSLFDSLGKYDTEGSVQAIDLALVPSSRGGKGAAKRCGSAMQNLSDAGDLHGPGSGGDPDLIWILI